MPVSLTRAGLLGWAVVWLALPAAASAQAASDGRGFVAGRVGANLVGNAYRIREAAPVFGSGFSAGVFLSPDWAAEFELWTRSANPACCVGRERLYSLSVERLYARSGVRPYLAGGLTLLRSEIAASRLQVQVAAGVRVPVVRRVALDFDLRGNGGGSTMIVRPTVAVVYLFR